MEEQFVSYEIALQLKELGFDENCLVGYQTVYGGKHELLMPVNKYCHLKYYKKSAPCNEHVIQAPIWQQVIDWFREEHFIDISIVNTYRESGFEHYKYIIYKCNDTLIESSYKQYKNTREQAILKAIEYIKQPSIK